MGLHLKTRSGLLACPLKDVLRPDFTVPFRIKIIADTNSVRCLAIELDSRQHFWAHVQRITCTIGSGLRLRQTGGSKRNLQNNFYPPRITYASEIWSKGSHTADAIKLLKQRAKEGPSIDHGGIKNHLDGCVADGCWTAASRLGNL